MPSLASRMQRLRQCDWYISEQVITFSLLQAGYVCSACACKGTTIVQLQIASRLWLKGQTATCRWSSHTAMMSGWRTLKSLRATWR